MRNGNLIWGGVLILLGVLMLLDWMQYFWPVALILVGIWIVLGAYLRGSAKTENVAVDLQGAHAVALRINHGAGRLKIGAGASMGRALEGECTEGARVHSSLSGERLEVRVSGDVTFIPFVGSTRGLDWNLRLSNEVPFTLDLETGANEAEVNLSDLRASSVNLKTGASSTGITMPATGQVSASVQAGAAEVRIRIPAGAAGRIRSQSGLAEIAVDSSRFPFSNGVYESPDFGTSPNRVDLRIEAGVGKVTVS
jgi:hypothetical protein